MLAETPVTVMDFIDRFATEKQCEDYLFKLRWPEGFRCPKCAHPKAYRTGRRLECANCGSETSLTAGTVLHKTRTPLRVWFWAAFMMARSKQGISANELSRQCGIRQEDAWLLCQKLRYRVDETQLLGGLVEADECYIGGVEKLDEGGKGGRSHEKKALVAVAVEARQGKKRPYAGAARLQVIDDATKAVLTAFITLAVLKAPTTLVKTDGWGGYAGLKEAGYRHEAVAEDTPDKATSEFPWVHRLIANLKAWLWGTFRSVSKRYLPQYVREFNFRFNGRRHEPGIFEDLLARAARNTTITMKHLQCEFRG